MSRRRAQSEHRQWSGAGDAGVLTRRQGLRSRPQQQDQGVQAGVQPNKLRGSKRPRHAPPAVADGSPGNSRKRPKVLEATVSGSICPEQVAQRRSERLKHCLRVGYRNLDRFGTKEPVLDEIADGDPAPRGGGDVEQQQVQADECQDSVLKGWGKRKRRWSRVKEEVDAAEHGPVLDVWLHVDVAEVQGSREINAWIRKSRKELRNRGQVTYASSKDSESSPDGDVGISVDRRYRLPPATRKRPRMEKRLADLGDRRRGGIENCVFKGAVVDSVSDPDASNGDSGLRNASSPAVTTGKDLLGLLEGGNDNDDEGVLRSVANEIPDNNMPPSQTSECHAGSDHMRFAKPVSSAVSDKAEVLDSVVRPAEGDDALRCPIRLGSPARVSADAVSDLGKAQALSSLVATGEHGTESSRRTKILPGSNVEGLSAVPSAQSDDFSVSQGISNDRKEGGVVVSASKDDLPKDDVGIDRSADCPPGKCTDDGLRDAEPCGGSGTVQNDETGLSEGTLSVLESRSESKIVSTNGSFAEPEQALLAFRVSNTIGKEVPHRFGDDGRKSVLDHVYDGEERSSNVTSHCCPVVEDQLLADANATVSQQRSLQETSQFMTFKDEAETSHVQDMASLHRINSFLQETCRETVQRCIGGWIEDERLDIEPGAPPLECTENLNREGCLSLVKDTRGSSGNAPETEDVSDGCETIKPQTGWLSGGVDPSCDVGLAEALQNADECEPFGEEPWLSRDPRAQRSDSGGVHTCGFGVSDMEFKVAVVTRSSPSLGYEEGTSRSCEPPARVEEARQIDIVRTEARKIDVVRTEAEPEDHEVSELQKALLESFHSFQDSGDGVFVSEQSQPEYIVQLTKEVQLCAGSEGNITPSIKHTESQGTTLAVESLEGTLIQCKTFPRQYGQNTGVCGQEKDTFISSSARIDCKACGDNKPDMFEEAKACDDDGTGLDERVTVSAEFMVEDVVWFAPHVTRDSDSLGTECRESQEPKPEGQEDKCLVVDIGMQEMAGNEQVGSMAAPSGQSNLVDDSANMVEVPDLEVATDRTIVDAAANYLSGTMGSQENSQSPVSYMESQFWQSVSVSKFRMLMESESPSSLIAVAKQSDQILSVHKDDEVSASVKQLHVLTMESDDKVKVYSRRKRGRDLHLLGVDEISQHLGGDSDACKKSDPVCGDSLYGFSGAQEKSGSQGGIDRSFAWSTPKVSEAAISARLLNQGDGPQQDSFLKCSDKVLFNGLGDCRPASSLSNGGCPKNREESPADSGFWSQQRNSASQFAHEETGHHEPYSDGVSASGDVATSVGAYEETVLATEEAEHYGDEGNVGVGEVMICTSQNGRETGQKFISRDVEADRGALIMAAELGDRVLHCEEDPALSSQMSRLGETLGKYRSNVSDSLLVGIARNDLEDTTVSGGFQSEGMDEASGQEPVLACNEDERAEAPPVPGHVYGIKLAGDELICGSAVEMLQSQLEKTTLSHSVRTPVTEEGEATDAVLVQKAESTKKQSVLRQYDVEANHVSDGVRKNEGDGSQKIGVEKCGDQSADSDLNPVPDLHAAYLRSLKCGLCGGSSDGRPAKDMPTEDGKPLHGKSVLDKGEGFEDSEGWLGQFVGPLTSRTSVQGVWVHRQCAIWSPEVYFSEVGRMKNVKAALRRGRFLKCTSCNQPGATIGCCMERCPRTFHLPCARLEGCVFDHVKYLMTCIDHMHLLHPRGQKKSGKTNTQTGLCDFEDGTDFHVGGFTRMVRERRIAAACARLKDLEAEERWVENIAEDEEFLRRERKRLQRDLARMVPVQVGGQAAIEDGTCQIEGWDSIAGLEDVIHSLKEAVTIPLLYPDLFSGLGICPPRGVLLHGYPGTGKTHVVRALVGACARGGQKVAYFARKGADCLGKYVGDAERQLRLLFQIAEECQPSIIFFDEMDGLAPRRSGQNDQTHSSVVSTLLALMDGLNSRGSVVVIGATNRADALDPALRRPGRFDREILFRLPSVQEREAILALHTRKWAPSPSVNLLSAVARVTAGFAGADLQAVCVEAVMTALRRTCPISKLVECAENAHSITDIPPVQVQVADWAAALRNVSPPCSKRKTFTASSTRAAPLPKHMERILLPYVLEVLVTLHLDSRASLPPELQKLVLLVKHSIMSYAGHDTEGTMLPSNWLVLLRTWPSEAYTGQILAEALVKAGITYSGEKFEDSNISIHSSESDCDSSGKDVRVVSQQEKDLDSKHGVDFTSLLKLPVDLGHKSSSQGRINVMIAGAPKSGQSLIAAALLHAFECFGQVRVLSLPTMLQEGNGSVSEGLLSALGEAKRASPCIIFMPNFEHWALERATTEDVESSERPPLVAENGLHGLSTERGGMARELLKESNMKSYMVASGSWKVLVQFLKLCNDSPILLLATSELLLEQHPSCVSTFFSGSNGNQINVCSTQSVPSASVEVPIVTVGVPEIFEAASEGIAKAVAGDFVRKLCRLTVRYNRAAEDIPHPGGSDSFVEKLVEEQVAAGSTTEPVLTDIAGCEDQDLPTEIQDEHKDTAMPGSAEQAGNASLVNEVKASPLAGHLYEDSDNKLPSKCRVLPCEGMSAIQKTLMSAIVYCGFQLLHDPQFRELRKATARLKVGPQVNIRDKSGLDSSNVNEYCQQFSCQDGRPGSSHGPDSNEGSKELWVRGIVAVGLTAYRGLYSTATEVAWEVQKVIELLHQRISKRVESGANRWDYFPITSQAAALLDLLGSWRHEVIRLEEAAVQPSAVAASVTLAEGPGDSACGLGPVLKYAAQEERGLPNVGLGHVRTNLPTEKAATGQSQDVGLSTQTNACSVSQPVTAEHIEGVTQKAQHCRSNNSSGCRDKKPQFSLDIHVDPTSICTDIRGTPAACPVQRSTIVAKFTRACLEKLRLTVKHVLLDAWQQDGATTSVDLLNDLITGSAASAMSASRGSLKAFSSVKPSLLQDTGPLDCGSAVCWEQVNCLCTTRHKAGDAKLERATFDHAARSVLAEGTDETCSKAWKGRNNGDTQPKNRVVIQEPSPGLHKGTRDALLDVEGYICLCPVVMALEKQKFRIRGH